MPIVLLSVLLLLAGCQTLTPAGAPSAAAPGPTAPVWGLEAANYRIDRAGSDLRIHVFRGGRAPLLGKNHVLQAAGLEGALRLPGDWPGDAAFALRFRAEDLVLDDPAVRAEIGGSFAAPLTEAQIAGTRSNLLGPAVLNGEQHPWIEVRSLRIDGDWPWLVARVSVAAAGGLAETDVLIEVLQRDADALRLRGQAVLPQTALGLTPFSVLGGLIALQDPLLLQFTLRLEAVATSAP